MGAFFGCLFLIGFLLFAFDEVTKQLSRIADALENLSDEVEEDDPDDNVTT